MASWQNETDEEVTSYGKDVVDQLMPGMSRVTRIVRAITWYSLWVGGLFLVIYLFAALVGSTLFR
jgi:hypothetical protein